MATRTSRAACEMATHLHLTMHRLPSASNFCALVSAHLIVHRGSVRPQIQPSHRRELEKSHEAPFSLVGVATALSPARRALGGPPKAITAILSRLLPGVPYFHTV